MNKMRYILFTFALVVLAGAAATCWVIGAADGLSGSRTTIPDSETQSPAPTTADIPASLACHVHDGKSIVKWPNIPASDIPISDIRYMVTDGDLLWAATDRGVMRLNVRSWQCDLFEKTPGFQLTNAFHLLPDGKGGLWVNTRLGVLLHFDGKTWRPVYEGYKSQYAGITTLGFNQAGDMCLQEAYGRFGTRYYFVCPKKMAQRPTAAHSFDIDSDQTLDCALWRQASSSAYSYTTSAGCHRIRRLLEQVESSETLAIAVSDGDEAWLVFPRLGGLHHWQDGVTEYSQTPHKRIYAVALDPVYGGAWLATDEGLAHVQTRDGLRPDQRAPAKTNFAYQTLSLHQETFPGSVSALAVDVNDHVWAVNGQSVLRYEKADRSWRHIITATHSADTIAADPVQGIWVAGRGELVYLSEQILRWPAPGVITPTALLADGNRQIWLGTLESGVWMTMPSEGSDTLVWRKFSDADGLPDLRITALAQGPHGHIYAAHHAGVSLFDPGVKRWITLPNSTTVELGWANALAFDQAGRLWVGYYPGVTVRLYENERWIDYNLPPDTTYGIDALLVDTRGTLWAGVSGMIGRGLPWVTWHLPSSLWRWPAAGEGRPGWESFAPEPDDFAPAPEHPILRNALTLALDAAGRIWAGGEEGISVWEGDR